MFLSQEVVLHWHTGISMHNTRADYIFFFSASVVSCIESLRHLCQCQRAEEAFKDSFPDEHSSLKGLSCPWNWFALDPRILEDSSNYTSKHLCFCLSQSSPEKENPCPAWHSNKCGFMVELVLLPDPKDLLVLWYPQVEGHGAQSNRYQ